MSDTYYVAYDDTSGNVKSAGFCNFSTEGILPSGQTQRTDCPFPAKIEGQESESNVSHWTGSAWDEVAQP